MITRTQTLLLTSSTLLAFSCNSQPTEDLRVSSETHWLQTCDTDAVCGDYACVCGICTLRCDNDDTCDGAAPGQRLRCVLEGQSAFGAVCTPDNPSPKGVCLPTCDGPGDDTCPSSSSAQRLTCATDACVPTRKLLEIQKIDLLFVIDSSGSMCEEQAQLRDNANRIVQRLTERSVDFQAAIITTDLMDSTAAGQLQSIPDAVPGPACTVEVNIDDCPNTLSPILRVNDPAYLQGEPLDANTLQALQRDLGCLFTVGTSGSGFEMGLEASRLALTPPLLNTTNAGILRDDAHLAVIFITDENDCSFEGNAISLTNANQCEWSRDNLTPTSEYIDFYNNLKTAPWRVLVTGIIAPDDDNRYDAPSEVLPSCISSLGTGYAGYRYQEVFDAFSAPALNICAEGTFGAGIDAIVQRIVEIVTP